VPLIAHTAGVEDERPRARDLGREPGLGNGHEPCLGIGCEEAPVAEKALGRYFTGAKRPLEWRQCIEFGSAEPGAAGDVEGARATVLEAGEASVLIEDVGGGAIGEGFPIAQTPRHLAQHPPVGLDPSG